MKKAFQLISSPVLMAVCLTLFAVSMAVATFVESSYSTQMARHYIYNAKWFELILLIGSINLLVSVFTKKLYRKEKFSIFLFHMALVIIIIGAGITRYIGIDGTMQIREGESSDFITLSDGSKKTLPFSLYLADFIVDYYPGSTNPSGYESKVRLADKEQGINEERRIYMNNVLKHRGYRFFQSSYHQDKLGTILSVNKDGAGTMVTYLGYFLLALGMAWSLLNRNSRFSGLIKNKTVVLLLTISSFGFSLSAQNFDSLPVIPKAHADKFGSILVRDYQGRTKPVSTLTSDIFRKISRKTSYNNQNSSQILLGMLVYPEKWQNIKIVYIGDLASEALQLDDKKASLLKCYLGEGVFISSQLAWEASQKQPSSRTKTENALIRVDERLNIIYHWFMGNMLDIFPLQNDNSGKWYNPVSIQDNVLTSDSVFVENVFSMYLSEVKNSVETGDWSMPDKLIDAIKKYQGMYSENLPSVKKVKLEQWYYKSDIYKYVYYLYFLFGQVILVLMLIRIFNEKRRFKIIILICSGAITGAFLLHTIGMGVRWYISGHAPWSNAYESMLFIAWTAVLAGLIFIRKSTITTALAAIMSSIFLMTAHMSWMDPQITNLVPVLKSVWLVIHVAVITSSYGFLGVGSIMAFINLLLMGAQTRANAGRISTSLDQLSRIIEISLIIGLYLLTIGTFLGGVWANVSWGRYWGWDSKETWALITVIIYAFVLHMHLIPKMKGKVLLNSFALLAYASVLMTYFGVNYYLTGMHSYASGDPAPIPPAVYYTIGILAAVITWAGINTRRLRKIKN